MLRGGVFIGVNRPSGGGFATLDGATKDAKRMHDWAVDPALGAVNPDYAHLVIDDEETIVTPNDILAAVGAVLSHNVDQLILYFSGHGMLVDGGETWLLSQAPLQRNAAINVAQTIEDAKSGRVPHVVVISDACRTPASTVQTQRVQGFSALLNDPVSGRENRVDVFYATGIGQSALELNTAGIHGVYTDLMREALLGQVATVLRSSEYPGDIASYVWSGPLGVYLNAAMADRLIELNIDEDVSPKFDIQYGDENLRYLARIVPSVGIRLGAPSLSIIDITPPPAARSVSPFPEDARTITQLANALLFEATEPRESFEHQLDRARNAPAPGARSFISDVKNVVGPQRFYNDDYATIVKVQGATILSAVSRDWAVTVIDRDRIIEIGSNETRISVVVAFDNETVAVLPTLPGFVTNVVLREREILEVSFERRIDTYDPQTLTIRDREWLETVRRARAISSASARHSRFNVASNAIDGALADAPGYLVDPTISIYAAYSLNDRADKEGMGRLSGRLLRMAGPLFDVFMLDGRLAANGSRHREGDLRPRPFMPLLTRGWDVLDGKRRRQLPVPSELRQWLLPSLWTLFDFEAFPILREIERL